MPRRHSQERQRWPLGGSSSLLPVAQRVNADPQRLGELLLGESDETTQRDDFVSTGDVTSEDAFALPPRNPAGEVPRGQLWGGGTSPTTHGGASAPRYAR